MLIVFSGLPGTGKTTLAKDLAATTGAVYLRIDTIEQAIRNSGALAQDVRRWMDRLPVAAHRESWPERLWRHAGRFRVAIAVVLCYLVLRMIVLLALGR